MEQLQVYVVASTYFRFLFNTKMALLTLIS